ASSTHSPLRMMSRNLIPWIAGMFRLMFLVRNSSARAGVTYTRSTVIGTGAPMLGSRVRTPAEYHTVALCATISPAPRCWSRDLRGESGPGYWRAPGPARHLPSSCAVAPATIRGLHGIDPPHPGCDMPPSPAPACLAPDTDSEHSVLDDVGDAVVHV